MKNLKFSIFFLIFSLFNTTLFAANVNFQELEEGRPRQTPQAAAGCNPAGAPGSNLLRNILLAVGSAAVGATALALGLEFGLPEPNATLFNFSDFNTTMPPFNFTTSSSAKDFVTTNPPRSTTKKGSNPCCSRRRRALSEHVHGSEEVIRIYKFMNEGRYRGKTPSLCMNKRHRDPEANEMYNFSFDELIVDENGNVDVKAYRYLGGGVECSWTYDDLQKAVNNGTVTNSTEYFPAQ